MDAAAAAQWVEALPEGKQREMALNAYAQVASKEDPEAASAWAAAIKDPSTRTAHQVFTSILNEDRAAAYPLAFPEPYIRRPPVSRLLELPGVPEEYKKPWLGL